MNKYQRLVIVAALINTLVMLLFPPFTSQPLARGMLPGFDGFYPLLTQVGSKPVFKELLSLELMFLAINTLAAWLALQSRNNKGSHPDFSFIPAIGWFTVVNLAIIFIFPPFESYPSLLRSDSGGFDSFYYVFGRRSQPAIFWPLLYLECTFVAINALAHILLFSAVKSGDDRTRPMIGGKYPPENARLGRRTDDRRRAPPGPVSEERRTGKERRTEPGNR